MAEHRTLIRGGSLFTSDPTLPVRADVLVVDGLIADVAPDIVDASAEIVEAEGHIVLPGLVDTHRHLWQTALRHIATDWTIGDYVAKMINGIAPTFEPEDVYIANLVGSLEAIDAGTTTIMDWSHIVHSPQHADAALEALAASRIRAVYGYGLGSMPAPEWYEEDLRRISGSTLFDGDDSRLSLALASWGPEFADLDSAVRDLALARDLGIPTSLHVGVGLLGAARTVTQLDARGLLGPDLVFVHANTATDEELARIAETGGGVSVSARVEMQMGHGHPATGRMIDAGLQPSLSVDVVSGVPGTIFSEMRAVLDAERLRQNVAAIERGEWTARLELTARDVVEMATIGGARALGMEESIGSLTPGKQADIVVLHAGAVTPASSDDVAAAIVASDAPDVRHVMIAGEFVKRDGVLRSQDMPQLAQELQSSRARLVGA